MTFRQIADATLQQIAELTRLIALHESEEVFASWLYFLMGSAVVKEAVKRATPPSEEVKRRLMERSELAREIIELQDESVLEETISELSEQDARLGKSLQAFYEAYRDVVEALAEHGYGREPRTRDVNPIVE